MMRHLVLCLSLVAGPAMAQEAPRYDPGILAACLEGAGTAETALRDCVGLGSTRCMADPGGETTLGMVGCLRDEAADWDRRLNEHYGRAIRAITTVDVEIGSDPQAGPVAPLLRQAQRDWIAFRDSACGFERLRYRGGSLGGPASQDCLLRLTAEQALRLRRIAEDME